MVFEPGHKTRSPTTFKPGQSGNPGGRAKGVPTARRQSIDAILEVVEAVMQNPEVLVSVREQFRKAITTNAPKALRDYILPFAPIVTASTTQSDTGKQIHRLSVSQLRAIAAELPDD